MDESDDDHRNSLIAAADEARRRSRARFRSKIADLIRSINKPLHVIIAEHALPHIPPQPLQRLRSVSASWNLRISSPLFAHTQSLTHSSLCGFFTGPTLLSFLPLDPTSHSLPDSTLSFLPFSRITVKSSSKGLICCIADFKSNYIICNPSTTQWTSLPKPEIYHGIDPNIVLLFNPSAYNFNSDYFLVCAYEIGDGSGIYGFDVFSSVSGTWRASSDICLAEEIVDGSGIAAGDVVCWRSTMQTVVIYEPAADRSRMVTWPVGYEKHVLWELAAIAGKLCCVTVTYQHVSVYALGPDDQWGLLGDYLSVPAVMSQKDTVWTWVMKDGSSGGEAFRGLLRPLRFQSGKLDAVVVVDRTVYVLDLVRREVRHVFRAVEMEGNEENMVAHISTLAPVYPQAK